MEYIKLDRQFKIRTIVKRSDRDNVYGLTIPKSVTSQFMDTYFNLIVSGNNIILESGCKNG